MQETNAEEVGFRLSPQQSWLLADDGRRAVVQCAAVLSGPVREPELRAAFDAIAAHHEILRTTFPRTAGLRDRSQLIHDALAPAWHSAPDGEPADAAAALSSEVQEPFDLDNGPLVRGLLVGSGDRSLLVLTADGACADAESLLLILAEVMGRYAGSAEADEPVQYADYAEWRHALITGDDEEATSGREVWRRHAEALADAAPVEQTDNAEVAAAPAEVVLSPDQAASVRSAASAAGVSAVVFVEAGWHALLARLGDADELVLAGWCDGRAAPDLAGVIGAYAQPVPIQTRSTADTSFAEVVDQVRRARSEQTRWQDFAGGEDLAALGAAARAGFAAVEEATPVAGVERIAAVRPGAPTGVLLTAADTSDTLTLEVWPDPQRPAPASPGELARYLKTLLLGAAADLSRPVAELPLADADERGALVAAAAGPAPAEGSTTPFHHLFERLAAEAPEAPAVAAGRDELSYGELNVGANRIANLLREAGLERGEAVGLCLERQPRLLVALLGIVKAGGAYLPLNFEHPPARIAHQLSEAGARFILTENHLAGSLPEFAGQVLRLDGDDAARIAASDATDPEHIVGAEDLVYIMYTSGSTGVPKGVKVTHGNLANYSTDMAARLAGGTRGLRFGVVSAISTDLGNTAIFPALVSGGAVQLISPGASMDSGQLAAELGERRLDVLKLTPSHLRVLLAGDDARSVLPRRWLVVGGEALRWEMVQRIREAAPDAGLINHYGPTETTIGSCAYVVGEPRTDCATVPIGRPISGTRAHVLDRALSPVPVGVPGELCISGAGVTAGYVSAPANGAGAGPFVPDPFADGDRMYRTGDRVRKLGDGAIEFLGRVDDQVKIRGFRIEPAEVEAVLASHGAIRQAAVVPEADDRGELRLVAYITTSGQTTVEELQSFLGESLPDYMVPGTFATLDALPFTPSGKIDRKALAEQATGEMQREAQFVAPRDEIEEQIAGIWAELLGTDQVGVFDDFFALGGHSLLATQAIMRIRREHGNIPLRALLAAPTVATLAEVVRGGPLEPA